MSRFSIEASTPLCLLQDAGRFGVRHLGVTQGGAADWVSMAWANWKRWPCNWRVCKAV